MPSKRLIFAAAAALLILGGYAIGAFLGTGLWGAALALAGASVAGAVVLARMPLEASRLVTEALAERYHSNFLSPVAEVLATTPPRAIPPPYRMLVLIPDSAARRNEVTEAVAALATRVEIDPASGRRRYGVYVYTNPKSSGGDDSSENDEGSGNASSAHSNGSAYIVDVPSALCTIEEEAEDGHVRHRRAEYARFARNLAAIIERKGTFGVPVQIVQDVRDFPLSS
jgi:hypothetical protein